MDILTAVPVQYWVIGSWAAACGGYDLAFRRIPNVLTLGAHGGALTMLATTGQGWLGASPTSCLVAWALALVLTMPAYAVKLLGAGDAKMLAAMGLAGGMEPMLVAYAIAGLLVGGTSVIWVLAYWWAPQLESIGIAVPAIPEPKGRMLPFGLGLAIGLIVTLVLLIARISILPVQFDW